MAACSPVEVEVPNLAPDLQAACDAFLGDLPDPLLDFEQVEVDPPEAPARAYGDPAVVISCVDRIPADFDQFAFCVQVSGVGWYLPDEQIEDDSLDATFTAVGFEPMVSVRVPAQYRQVTGGDVLADLADAVKDNLTETKPCR